nr:Tn3 family transposase [Burkholderia sp. Bp8963]
MAPKVRSPHQGKIPAELTRHRHTLMAVSSALSLLTNAVLAWNTVHMQRAVERIEVLGQRPVRPEYLRRIAPTNLEGINLRGTFDFPVADFARADPRDRREDGARSLTGKCGTSGRARTLPQPRNSAIAKS